MLDAIEGPHDAIAELQAFRESMRALISQVAAQMALRNKMNDQKVEALCAKIETAVRDYSNLLMRLNTVRSSLEANVPDHDAFIALRREWGVANTRSSLLRVELNQWSLMRDMIQLQVASRKKRVPLYEKQQSALATSQSSASDHVFDWVHAILNQHKQSNDAYESGCFPDIALPNSEFHKHLHAAYRVLLSMGKTDRMRFLDVGCGGGLKVLSARLYFKKSDGLDYQQTYVDAAREMLEQANLEDANAFQADALTFDGYGGYEVIYFYRPIRDHEKIIEMEQRIIDSVEPGTLLIAPYCGFGQRYAELGCGRVDGSVYMAKTSQNKADQWRRKAEQTGAAVVHVEEERMPTIWTPLLKASRQSGYDIARHVPLI